jgi:hypothetical protein
MRARAGTVPAHGRAAIHGLRSRDRHRLESADRREASLAHDVAPVVDEHD